MQRSDFVMKLMSVLLLVALAVYIGIYVYKTADNPLKTALAVRYTVQESGGTDGYIVRNETVLTGGGSTVTLMVSEGEKVAVGEALAISYQGASALERASEIRALQLQISAAESDAGVAAGSKPGGAGDSVMALSNAVQHKNLENLPSLSMTVEDQVFKESAGKLSSSDLAALKTRLSGLLAKNTDSKTVAAPASGVFSAVVDGFEPIGPNMLNNLSPSALDSLFAMKKAPGQDVLGKLISGITWYYAAIMDNANVQKLTAGNTAVLQFTKTYNAKLQMKIESIGPTDGSRCVVVFSAKSNLSDITALRKLTGQVLFESQTGLLVPKDAVRYEDGGKAYVYIITGLQARKVAVTILRQNGDSYVVQDGAENGTNLREGCEIIVKAKDLYNGKVVGR